MATITNSQKTLPECHSYISGSGFYCTPNDNLILAPSCFPFVFVSYWFAWRAGSSRLKQEGGSVLRSLLWPHRDVPIPRRVILPREHNWLQSKGTDAFMTLVGYFRDTRVTRRFVKCLSTLIMMNGLISHLPPIYILFQSEWLEGPDHPRRAPEIPCMKFQHAFVCCTYWKG